MRRRSRIWIQVTAVCVAVVFCGASAFAAGSDPTEEAAQKLLDGMSLKEKIDQMLIVECPDSKPVSIQEKYQFGGYILFGDDFKGSTKKKLKKNISKQMKD